MKYTTTKTDPLYYYSQIAAKEKGGDVAIRGRVSVGGSVSLTILVRIAR